MARGNWSCTSIKPAARCRLCRHVIKASEFVRLDGIFPAHRACAEVKGRAFTIGPAIQANTPDNAI